MSETDGRGDSQRLNGLSKFLMSSPSVQAILVNPGEQTLSIATLGQVDEAELIDHLAEVMRGMDLEFAPDAAAPGISLKQLSEDEILLEKPSCPTAPSFWKWRSMPWFGDDGEEDANEWKWLLGSAAACGALIVAAFGLGQWQLAPATVVTCMYLLAIAAGGWDAAIDAWRGLRSGHLDVHFLMLAVAIGASAIGAYGEGALLLFLFSLSGALEAYAQARTRREVGALFKAAPRDAMLVVDGRETEVPVSTLRAGQKVRVRADALFPVDGRIVHGESAADESTLTGESVPVEKATGDEVFSGTLNLWGAVDIEVLRPARESSLQKIIRMIRDAQERKAPAQRFTDRFGTPYTWFVLALTTAYFLFCWLVLGVRPFIADGEFSAFYRAMTLLVVASPCALVLSIPSAILASIARGARHGILFRGGAAVEKLAAVDLVALDKTGTLTRGEMEVMTVESVPSGREREIAELAYALESLSSHPIARAIVRYGVEEGLELHSATAFQSVMGKGVRAEMNGGRAVLGRRELLAEGGMGGILQHLPPPPPTCSEVWVVREDLLGRILLRDSIRTESTPVLQALRDDGLRLAMLTGDRAEVAMAVGAEIGLRQDEIHGDLSPEDKLAFIERMTMGGAKVAMVGDGVNDAPSLAAAHVSIAMGAKGNDAAMEQGDVVLMNNRIDSVLEALYLGKCARRIIRQNLVVALGTVIVMIFAALTGRVPLTVGVIMHEGSTVLVCLNSMRLLFAGRLTPAGPKAGGSLRGRSGGDRDGD